MKRDTDIHDPERWAADLREAGWREVRRNVWERPDGALFRGPYGAWCALVDPTCKPFPPLANDVTKVFWLSFCDGDRPKGQQFLGACLIEVTADDAAAVAAELALRFPNASAGAEWIAAASRKAWALCCNPGGQMLSVEIPPNYPNLTYYQRGVLMDRATIEQIDQRIEADVEALTWVLQRAHAELDE